MRRRSEGSCRVTRRGRITDVAYAERPSGAPGVVLWTSTAGDGGTTILPDGCLDLVWDGEHLVVAGPDTVARHHAGRGRHVGLRLARGTGPAALSLRADEVRDATVDLAALWGDRPARALVDRVAADPTHALVTWARTTVIADPDTAGLFDAAGKGVPVAEIAARLGVTVRTLHRRYLPVFGYGPQHLARVLRLQRALALARTSAGTRADVAATAGYADQPHLARDVRALTGTTLTALLTDREDAQPSGANRSTVAPSGSWTTA